MAFEYIGELLEEAVRDVNPVETRGRVEQVVGTITAVDTFLGVILGISTSQYNKTADKEK